MSSRAHFFMFPEGDIERYKTELYFTRAVSFFSSLTLLWNGVLYGVLVVVCVNDLNCLIIIIR